MGESPAPQARWQELSRSECFDLLATERLGRVAFADDRGPANAAFLIGLSLWLAGQDEQWTYALPFERADHGLYRAAQSGLSAQLSWPAWQRDQATTVSARELVTDLVPAARKGLLQAGVAAAEADLLLGVIAARAASGQTGAAWQRAMLATAERGLDRQRALAVMLERYVRNAQTGLPVHSWPVD